MADAMECHGASLRQSTVTAIESMSAWMRITVRRVTVSPAMRVNVNDFWSSHRSMEALWLRSVATTSAKVGSCPAAKLPGTVAAAPRLLISCDFIIVVFNFILPGCARCAARIKGGRHSVWFAKRMNSFPLRGATVQEIRKAAAGERLCSFIGVGSAHQWRMCRKMKLRRALKPCLFSQECRDMLAF